jgi:hypothetical protein
MTDRLTLKKGKISFCFQKTANMCSQVIGLYKKKIDFFKSYPQI